jgi:3-oxoacyl-[acyl-carrier protein] reductase
VSDRAPRPEAPRAGAVLVTGGNRGIGQAIVEGLVAAGYPVAFTYHSDEAKARALEKALDGRARALALDLNDEARPAALVAEAEQMVGDLVGLVNNAGLQRDALLAMTPDSDWNAVLQVNLGGLFRCCRAVVPKMMHRRRGSIVNVSSLSAIRGLAGQTSYAAAKAGVVGLTRALAREVGRRGVRVNAVLPGFVRTDLTASLPEATVAFLQATQCLPSGTAASDVAAAVLFLLSDQAAAITGQALAVDAGSSA